MDVDYAGRHRLARSQRDRSREFPRDRKVAGRPAAAGSLDSGGAAHGSGDQARDRVDVRVRGGRGAAGRRPRAGGNRGVRHDRRHPGGRTGSGGEDHPGHRSGRQPGTLPHPRHSQSASAPAMRRSRTVWPPTRSITTTCASCHSRIRVARWCRLLWPPRNWYRRRDAPCSRPMSSGSRSNAGSAPS